MKYYLYTNDEGFVSGFVQAEKEFNYDGDIPADLSASTPEGWYKLEQNKLIEDTGRKEAVILSRTNENRIAELEKLLSDTDYVQDGLISGLLQLKNPVTFVTDLIALLSSTLTEYPAIIAQRAEWIAELKTLKK